MSLFTEPLEFTSTTKKVSTAPIKIGEGSFGCVHRPAIQCKKTRKSSLKQVISKLGKRTEMEEELEKYELFHQADPEYKYHLGYLKICDPDWSSEQTINAIKSCNKGEKMLQDPSEYIMIHLQYGGLDLDKYIEQLKTMTDKAARPRAIKLWRNMETLLKGLVEFQKGNVIHNDIKPGNVMYKERGGDVRYIDFGLSDSYAEFKRKCETDIYDYGITFWNFPFESCLTNLEDYMYLKTELTEAPDEEHRNDWVDEFIADKIRPTKENNNWLRKMQQFTLGIVDTGEEGSSEFVKNLLIQMKAFLMGPFLEMSYDDFLQEFFRKMDVYSVGLTMLYVFVNIVKYLNMDQDSMTFQLLMSMVSFNMKERLDAATALERFQHILNTKTTKTTKKETHGRGGDSFSMMMRETMNNMTNLTSRRSRVGIMNESVYEDKNRDPPRNQRIPLRTIMATKKETHGGGVDLLSMMTTHNRTRRRSRVGIMRKSMYEDKNRDPPRNQRIPLRTFMATM